MVVHDSWHACRQSRRGRKGGVMHARRTRLLLLLVITTATFALFGFARLGSAREHSTAARRDLEICRGYLTELSRSGAAPSRAANSSDPAELSRRLHEAAATSGVADKLTTVDPYGT